MRKESNKNNDKLIHLSRFLFGDTSVTFTNENPTQTEKDMFEHYGLYLVEKTEDKYTYAPVHLKDGYTYLDPDCFPIWLIFVQWFFQMT